MVIYPTADNEPTPSITSVPVEDTGHFLTRPKGLVLAIAVLTVVRLVLLGHVQLLPEEAYYWMYAKHPAVCYLDHPPMVAWLIAIGTSVFGDTEFGVRFGSWLLATGSVGLCYVLGRDWGGQRAGLGAAAIFGIAPLYVGAGFLAMPDTPLLFFWLLVLVAMTRATRYNRMSWWLLAGVGTGLAFLSKYPAALLMPSALLFLLSDRRRARLLATPGPWVAVVVAVAIALPVIWWNWQHDWVSFKFQFARRYSEHQSLSLAKTAVWIGVQFGLLAPPIFLLLAWGLWIAVRRVWRDRHGRWRFAACFALPWLGLCFWHGLFTEVNINWPLPAYLSLLPVAAVLLRANAVPLLRRLRAESRNRLVGQFVVAMAIINAGTLAYISLPNLSTPRPNILRDWNEVGRQVVQAEKVFSKDTNQDPFIVTVSTRYQLASELAFYTRDLRKEEWKEIWPGSVLLGGGLSYGFWAEPARLMGTNALIVSDEPISPFKLATIQSAFERTESPVRLFTQTRGLIGNRTYYIMRCYGFRGLGLDAKPATSSTDYMASHNA